MPFIPLDSDKPDRDSPRIGFNPVADQPRRGFTPIEPEPERPSMAKMLALNNPLTAIAEAGANLASQAVALPVAGIAGLATEAGNALGLTEKKGADVVQSVGEALTYQPRGEMGKAAAGIVAYPFEKLAEAGQWAGGKTLEATDSPLAATAVDTAVNALPMLIAPAKKGAVAVKERIAGKEMAPVEAVESSPGNAARVQGDTNAAPLVSEATRPAEGALARQMEVTDGTNLGDAPGGVLRVVEAEGERQGSGFADQPGTGGIRGVHEADRAAPNAGGAAAPEGIVGGLHPGERGLGHAADRGIAAPTAPGGIERLAEYAADVRQPEAPSMAAVRGGGDQGVRALADLRELPGRPGAEAGAGPSAIARGSDARLRAGEYPVGAGRDLGNVEAGTAGLAVERGRATTVAGREGNRHAAVDAGEAARLGPDDSRPAAPQAPRIDPNAGPLSRSAAIAAPELVKPAEMVPGARAVDTEPRRWFPPREMTSEAAVYVKPVSGDWAAFPPGTGALGVPRAEMPQIKAEHRGAMTQYMNARSVAHLKETVPASSLKPTQAEYSPAKVRKATGFEGGERSILISSDNYVLDGHHQWLAKANKGEPINVIRFDAPISDLVKLAHDFPSSGTAKGGRVAVEPSRGFTPLADTQRAAQPGTEYSFAPGSAYQGFINDAAHPLNSGAGNSVAGQPLTAVGRGKPIRREEIIVPFAKDLGASIYTGRVNIKNALGFFRRGNEEVRIKRHADLEVTAHEMAHLIDSRVPAISNEWRSNKALREQLKSVSYDHKSVTEGFAEGVRLWMTQPDVLAQRAPLVHDWLTNFAASDKKYGPPMRKAQEGMTGWFAQDAVDRARSKIGDHRPLSDAMDGALDRFRQSVSDDLHGVYRMERDLQGGKITAVGAYESARLSRASASIADGAVRFGYPVKRADGAFEYRGKGLQDIMKPVADHLDDALLYFVGRSAQELMMQKREHLFTQGEIKGMLALETPEARKAFAEYQAWNRGILDFAEAQGVLNPETRRQWKRTEYLPFHRVEQPGGLKGKPGDWAGIQALTGGTENIRDVLGNMIGNAAQLVDVAVKNEARLKIADLASRPGGGKFMVKIEPGSRPVKVGGNQVMDEMLKRYGLAVDGEIPAFFEFMLHNQPPAGGNVAAVLKGGKPVWYEVADPILLRSLEAIDRPPMPWLTRWLGMPKRVGQATITLTPDFMLANIARDTIMGGVMSRSGFRPVLDSLRGMRLRMTEDPLYKDYIANGGGLSSLYLDENHLRTKLEKFYHDQGIDYRTVLDTPDKLLGFVETLADAFEMSTRLGEYDRAIKAGEHPRHAAYQGREVSTDFAMRGDSKALGFMYDTVMFLRPAVVSMDRLARGVAHDPNKAAIGAKTAMLALSSVGLYLLNRDDPRYQGLNDWDRDANWHFFIGNQHFRYPKIWEIGAVASVAERTTEKLMQGEPAGLGKDFARIVGNTFSLNFMPQILAPIAEQATNRNSFTKAPIETPGMENLQPFLRAKPNTSETMKALGMATRNLPEGLQFNPARGEALLRGYLNTWGMYGLMLTDKAFFGDKQPEMRTDQMPVVRRFYSQEPPQHTKFETQFYDMLGEAKRLHGTMRELDRMGRPEIADQKEQSPLAGESKPLERAAKNLQGINADMRDVRKAPDLTPSDKRQRLDALTIERNALLKAAVQDAKAAQAAKP